MANKYPFRLSGYIYSKGTKAGFSRMQRLGIPRPLFRLEDKLARFLKENYVKVIKEALQDLKTEMKNCNVSFTGDSATLTQDSLEDLLAFFDQMKKEMEAESKKQQNIANRANMASVADTLEKKWLSNANTSVLTGVNAQGNENIRNGIETALKEEQGEYLGRLFEDADSKTQGILQSFSIDKQKLFNDNMAQIRALYIDNSLERIAWEENGIKRAILKRILEYVNGETDTLKLDDLTKLAFDRGDHLARLFARDQMQRFNKAVTLSTFINAGVTKIKWVTCHDVRVRETHRALDGKIFSINDLPPEIDDYNCRCGLVPVEWAD